MRIIKFHDLLLLLALHFFAHNLTAQPITWKEVAPVFYTHCGTCHRPGGIGPFNILDYSIASAYARGIKFVVERREMPPWPADPTYRHYHQERVLSAAEINAIVSWADQGAPSGDLSHAPQPPSYAAGPVIQNPDLVAQMPTFTVNTHHDLYQCFVIPTNLTEDHFITAVEVIPGNEKVVHHVQVFMDPAGASLARDAATPEPGYPCFGGVFGSGSQLIAGWVPGAGAMVFPTGIGERLPAGAYIIIQVHYPGGINNQLDSTQVRFTLTKQPLRELTFAPILNYLGPAGNFGGLENGPLFIPANTVKTFTARFDIPQLFHASAVSVFPHMHLVGKSIESFAVTPAGDTIPLVRVNDWDFHWQLTYDFQKLIPLPGGSKLYARAVYDNTSANLENPFSPPQNISGGDATTDEMLLVYFAYVAYRPGDENVIIDSSLLVTTAIQEPSAADMQVNLYPNPLATGQVLHLSWQTQTTGPVDIMMYNQHGQAVWRDKKYGAGHEQVSLSTTITSPGVYYLQLRSAKAVVTKKVIIQRS